MPEYVFSLTRIFCIRINNSVLMRGNTGQKKTCIYVVTSGRVIYTRAFASSIISTVMVFHY